MFRVLAGFVILTSSPLCTPDIVSEQGQWCFWNSDTIDGGESGPPYRFVEGTRTCPDRIQLEVQAQGSAEEVFRNCLTVTGTGVASYADECLTIEGVGPGTIDLVPFPCRFDSRHVVDDQVRVLGVAADQVQPQARSLAEDSAGEPHAGGGVVASDVVAGDQIFVLGDSIVRFALRMRDRDGAWVGWDPQQAIVELDGGELVAFEHGHVLARVGAGQTATLSLELAGAASRVIEITGVAVDDLREIEIVAPRHTTTAESLDLDPSLPDLTTISSVWTLYRTDDGAVVWGVPTELEYGGHEMVLRPASRGDEPVHGVFALHDWCEGPSDRTLRVRARSLVDGVNLQVRDTLTWSVPRETVDAVNETYDLAMFDPEQAEEDCAEGTLPPRACGCASTSAPGGLGLALVMLLAIARRRRA